VYSHWSEHRYRQHCAVANIAKVKILFSAPGTEDYMLAFKNKLHLTATKKNMKIAPSLLLRTNQNFLKILIS
jgi:hypothetical protein